MKMTSPSSKRAHARPARSGWRPGGDTLDRRRLAADRHPPRR
ncbi:hypothetical protein I553_7426 [Mycobacterium xenopi 4042]|uniref:Uncharacterized protein n=1 Tax=Mycobacterium xenopi 4042 TaxID=1299334 RepID=X8E8N3_MYCXE|nr:hypothetical protein I553_7426 [Mycobacterium xenopi 4042]